CLLMFLPAEDGIRYRNVTGVQTCALPISTSPCSGVGNDVGTEYRSAVYWTTPEQGEVVRESVTRYQQALDAAGRGRITTELAPLDRKSVVQGHGVAHGTRDIRLETGINGH